MPARSISEWLSDLGVGGHFFKRGNEKLARAHRVAMV